MNGFLMKKKLQNKDNRDNYWYKYGIAIDV